jgi:K(+)-stimulated pyrophosphate-energized sodium pump
VTELALILGIQAAGLAFAMAVGRSLFVNDQESPRFQRVARALERATLAVLAQAGRSVLIGVLVLVLISCLVHVYLRPAAPLLSPVQSALMAGLGLFLGATFAGASAYVALRIGVQASVSVSRAARVSLDRALSLAVRSGGAAALIGDALSMLGFSALFGVAFALKGGTTLSAEEALRLGHELTGVVPGFALGAALTALVLQRAAGTYRAASEVASNVAAELDAGLTRDDPRNPALVSGVAGTLLSGHAATIALSFTLASASHLCTLSLAARAVDSGAPVSSLFVPFVVRAFFLLASGFGLLVVRTEEMKSPSLALLRGQLSAAVIGWAGVLGTAFWLMRDEWIKAAVAGLVGIFCSMVGALTTWALSLRRPSSELGDQDDRAARDARPPGLVALGGVGRGFEALLLPVALIGPILLWCLKALAGDGAAAGTLAAASAPTNAVVALIGWSALVGMLPLNVAAGCVGAIASAARLISVLARAEVEALRRVQRLSQSRLSMASPRTQLLLVAAGTALLAALTLPGLAAQSGGLTGSTLEPIVLWSGALGSALVLAYAGASARAAAHGAERVALEVGRQLNARQTIAPAPVPDDFSPSYKSCVDLAARLSQGRVLPQALSALALPVLLAVGVRLFTRTQPIALVIDALVGFVAAASFTGFAAALTLDAAHAAVANRRLKRGADGSSVPIAAAGEALTTVLGHAASPAAQALVLATACIALSIAPFLH